MARLLPFLKMDTVLIFLFRLKVDMWRISGMRFRHRVCAQAEHMPGSHFFTEDPEKGSSGSSSGAPARCGAETQDVAVLSAGDEPICCVYPQCSDLARRGRYCRFAYSLTVLHFRKVFIYRKVGSPGNGHPVI
ncbi:hypothetical protein EXW94_28265 [Enterobacter sp. JMULE2]|nr:hypothetical protein [Enterobacter sp. JMULE2]NTZ41476.1 hypothetical protein [Enterobacter sp. JMULE2]